MSDQIVAEILQLPGLSEEDIHAALEAAASAQAVQEQARDEARQNTAKTVEAKLQTRMGTRKAKESTWLESVRLYLGSLSSYNLVTADYPFGTQSDRNLVHSPEVNIIREKCNAAISQTVAYQFAAGDKNWDINSPQVVDLDEHDMQTFAQMYPDQQLDMRQVMQIKADLMSREIQYHLDASDYGIEMRLAQKDWAILGTGVTKNPQNVGKLKKVYKKQATTDGRIVRIPTTSLEYTPNVYRVNPWYIFPDDTVTDIRHAEDCIEVHPMSKTELTELLSHPGYFKDQIQECIVEEPRQYINSPFNDPAYLTQGINLLKNKYLVLEFHGPIKKEDLEKMGVEVHSADEREEYFAEVWVANSRVIRIQLSNIESCYKIPYNFCVWEPDPASVFGFGIPMLARDQQRVVNESWKMVLDNAGISAGPQVVVDTTLIKPAEGGLECTPWKVWYSTEYGADVSKAINFFMPDNAVEGLLTLFDKAMAMADMESSIPLFLSGMSQPSGAGDSATQMAILNQNATSPLFFKAEDWDDCITHPTIEAMYDWEMQYNPKDEIKGTYEIDVRTSTAFLRNSMEQQKLRDLSMEITQGSPVGEYVNMDALTIARLMSMRLPYAGIVKDPAQVAKERAEAPPPQPDPNLIKAQAEMAKVDVEKQRLQMDAQRMQQDGQLKFQEIQIKAQAQERTDATRDRESQATVIKANLDFHTAIAGIASKDEQFKQKLMADMTKSQMGFQVDKFLAGMQMAAKAKDQELTKEELQLKRQKGTGI